MEDSTAHVQAMAGLVEVISTAIRASGQFKEESSTGNRVTCMTLFIRTAGGRELAVSVTDVEQAG